MKFVEFTEILAVSVNYFHHISDVPVDLMQSTFDIIYSDT